MSDIKYGKEIITTTFYDGTPTGSKREVEHSVLLEKPQLLVEIIDSLAVINSGESRKLTIEVSIDSRGRYKLNRKWCLS